MTGLFLKNKLCLSDTKISGSNTQNGEVHNVWEAYVPNQLSVNDRANAWNNVDILHTLQMHRHFLLFLSFNFTLMFRWKPLQKPRAVVHNGKIALGSDWLEKMEDVLCNHMPGEGAGNMTWFPFQINRQWNNQETAKVNEFSMVGTPAHRCFREGFCHKLQHQWWKTQVFCFIFHFLSHTLLSVILTDIWRNASEFTEISPVLNYCNTDQIPAHCPWTPEICKMCDGLFLMGIYTPI